MTTFNWQKLYRTIEEAQVEITASKAIFVYITARGWKTGYYNFQQPIRQKSPLFCKTTGAGSRRYGLNGRCPFFRVSSILTAISPAQMSRNRRIKPWSSENDKKEERAHRRREFQTVDNQKFSSSQNLVSRVFAVG